MTQVIYIDVLIIINIYIGYALLRLTGIICSSQVLRLRILLGSVIQGLYSLVILLPQLPFYLSIPVKAGVACLFVAASFRFYSLREFFRLYTAFLGISFAFAGIMLALWMMKAPPGMSYKNGAVYFTLDAITLAITTIVCYAISRLVYFFVRRRSPSGSIYTITVSTPDKCVTCRALLDTGNSLRDVFSGLPVIIIDEKTAKNLLGDALDIEKLSALPGFRLIPCSTVSGASALPAFRPQTVLIESVRVKHTVSAVFIGISKNKIRSGEFGALIGTPVLEGAQERRVSDGGKIFAEKGKSENHT